MSVRGTWTKDGGREINRPFQINRESEIITWHILLQNALLFQSQENKDGGKKLDK